MNETGDIPDMTRPKTATEVLNRRKLRLKQSLGQNLLVDRNILKKIVDQAQVTAEDHVLEIGPGLGGLTQVLMRRARRVTAVEIDSRMIDVLEDVFEDRERLGIVHADILDLEPADLLDDGECDFPSNMVSNLPYSSAARILLHLLEHWPQLNQFTITLQKEVAERLEASPGGKDYGSLTILVRFYASADIAFTVPPTVFIPRPKVESAVITLRRHPKPPAEIQDREFFFQVVKAAFQQRRKMLRNALRAGLPVADAEIDQALAASGVDPRLRGEKLTLEEFAALTETLLDVLEDQTSE